MSAVLARRPVRVALAVVLQLLLLGVAVWAPLSARLTGTEVRLRVAPVDPMEPLRGAYVHLTYPDLPAPREAASGGGPATVYIPLSVGGDGLAKGATSLTAAPADGVFLRCRDLGWTLECGIESWFLPQDKARAVEEAVRAGTAVATVRVDARGNAALVALDTSP